MSTVNRSRHRTTVRAHEGAPAKRIPTEAEFRRTVMACLLWERTFYEGGQDVADRIREYVRVLPAETSAAIAIEAREQMHLRHVPLLIVREMARQHRGTGNRPAGSANSESVVDDTLARVIQRPDEMTEFLAIYWKDGREPLAAAVKRGLARAFKKFDAYQLAKWDRPDREIRIRDVMFLTHPRPEAEEQVALWNSVANDALSPPDTWEVALSAAGSDPDAKREAWGRLLRENRLGGFALLRNLRNMQQAGIEDAVIEEAIRGKTFHRVLPFRFIAAARYAPQLEEALQDAMFRSLADLPTLPGKTALVVDHSGSMQSGLSGRSDMTRFEAACGVAMLLREICERVVVVAFSAPITDLDSYAQRYYAQRPELQTDKPGVAVVPPRRGFALRDALAVATPWLGTNTEDGKQRADAEGYDRIILITDEQSHQKLSDPKVTGRGYVVNVATYQHGIGYGAWTHIDGWSENVVRYIQAIEGVGAEAPA